MLNFKILFSNFFLNSFQNLNKEDFVNIQKEKSLKRKVKTSIYFDSPYMNKRVDTKAEYESQVEHLFPKIILQKALQENAM